MWVSSAHVNSELSLPSLQWQTSKHSLVTSCIFCFVFVQSEDLLWNDYEEKLSDQIVRTMENYTGQFTEVKVI